MKYRKWDPRADEKSALGLFFVKKRRRGKLIKTILIVVTKVVFINVFITA